MRGPEVVQVGVTVAPTMGHRGGGEKWVGSGWVRREAEPQDIRRDGMWAGEEGERRGTTG